MNTKQIQEISHQPVQPLSIERDWRYGREIIIIEGVPIDAEYIRSFTHPRTDCLFAARREDDLVTVTEIIDIEGAKAFFENAGGA